MDLKSTIAIILKDLEDARNIIDNLKNYPGVPAIQIELAKAKCRSAADVIKLVSDMEISPISTEETTNRIPEPEPMPEQDQESISQSLEVEGENIEVYEISDLEEKTGPDERVYNQESEIIDQIVQPNIVDKDSINSTTEPRKGKILADQFTGQSSINEQIATKRHKDDSDDLNKFRPIKDLTSAIGINEKFMFVRELFDGNQDLYRDTINELNKIDDIDQAFKLLSDSAPNRSESEVFDLLIDLVKRKLSTH